MGEGLKRAMAAAKASRASAPPAPQATELPTAPRFDRYGEIRYIGHIRDKGTRKTWVVIRRKGGDTAFAVRESEWLALAETRAAVDRVETPRLTVFGIAP